MNFQIFTRKRIKSNCFKRSVDIDDVESNQVKELLNNEVFRNTYKENNDLKIFYSSLSEIDFKRIILLLK